ncbi:MAG: DEAD/DEAH box helicase [Elusimicrobiota bacterium]
MKQTAQAKRETKRNISHLTKPQGMSLEDWQIILRRQVADSGNFMMKNTGSEQIFSTFQVTNPQTERSYRVVICGEKPGINYCSCPDFSVNTLGTCKHVEYVLNKLRKKRGASKLLKDGYIPPHSSLTLRYGLQRRVAICLGSGASLKLKELAAQFFDQDGFLTEWGFSHFDQFIERANILNDELHYHEDAMNFIANIRDVEVRKMRINKMFPQGCNDPKFKQLIKTNLYPYQKAGALFAALAGRSLIADDMGLGKTPQAIAAGEILARAMGIEKVLVICPTSLKHQWEKEIEKFSQRSAQVISGSLVKRKILYSEKSFFKIINYNVVYRDLSAIQDWAPDLIILDEAQRIKNWKTRLARSVKRLSSPYALVLTGTPLENRLEELHSIVGFIDQHHLGPLFRFLNNHQVADEGGKVVGYRNLNGLGKSLQPILIRRKKEEVLLQLPERMEKNYFVAMTSQQMDIHEENKDIVAKIAAKWRRYKFLSEQDKQRLMCALQNMRMVSDSTYLIDPDTRFGNKVGELEIQLQELFEKRETKVVIFSQWLRMLELVTEVLEANKWRYVWLHGGVPGHQRGELIQTFKERPDCRVFLSTEVGGVGLNLQNASTVINLDLPWNPAVLEQRIGRVHRLGQQQKVQVINFIAEGSIEQGMLALLKFKQSMFSGVLDSGANEVFMGTNRMEKFMRSVETATGAIPAGSEKILQTELKEAMEDAKISQEEVSEDSGQQKETKTIQPPAIITQETIGEFLRAGASFLQKISQQFDTSTKPVKGEAVLAGKEKFSGIKIEQDRNTGQQTLQIPLPDNQTMEKLLQIGSVFLSMLKK